MKVAKWFLSNPKPGSEVGYGDWTLPLTQRLGIQFKVLVEDDLSIKGSSIRLAGLSRCIL
jgi:hypothetical protein